MGTDNNNFRDTQTDHTYGGSKYRLSYDHAENRCKRAKSLGIKPGAVVLIVIMTALFLVFTYFALKHYKDTVKELYNQESDDTDKGTSADFQSNVRFVTD